MERVPMLAEGYEKLTAELQALRQERPLIVDAIEEARAHGDLSENAEYHAAKERQGQVEAHDRRDRGQASAARRSSIPTTLSGDRVVFGATVTVLDDDDKPQRYQIVGQTEADARQGRISYNSPHGPRADRQAGRRRGRSHGALGRPVLPGQEDRVHLSLVIPGLTRDRWPPGRSRGQRSRLSPG